jgi:hypothetical protein
MGKKFKDGMRYLYWGSLPPIGLEKRKAIIAKLISEGWVVRITKGRYGIGKDVYKRRPKKGEEPRQIGIF